MFDRGSRARWRFTGALVGCCVVALGAVYTAGSVAGSAELAALRAQRCDPLRVVDRAGRLLRTLPAACGVSRTHAWTALSELSDVALALVVIGEDRRFEQHLGVDPWAAVRAAWSDLRARKIVSGASTLSMQLVSLLHREGHTRAFGAKLGQAWRAFALERRADKREILEAYVNLAYYGAGASGIADAAAVYFGKPVHALSDAESTLLAVLPRAPNAYDLRHHLARAVARRNHLLGRLRGAHGLSAAQERAIEAEVVRLSPPTAASPRLASTSAPALDDASAPAAAAADTTASAAQPRLANTTRAATGADMIASVVPPPPAANTAPAAAGADTAASAAQPRLANTTRAATGADMIASVVPPPRLASPAPAPLAGHFVDWVLASLPERERLAGGTLITTLDAELQSALERAVREHVATHAGAGVSQAGVVVLDTQTGAVRGMVGSSGYSSSQLNIVTRRRHLGSLLKPFVYALALEAGESADSVALDIGDAPSEYRARDWVGREAGPLTYREALAGSYNLAAVHVLERVGVAALHERLRRAGVAELAAPPAHYGLPLALGSARVRLLDVVSGYGFMVRGGAVRKAYGIEALEHRDGSRFRPRAARDEALFSADVSARVMDMLSDAAARHRRFGRGLPFERQDSARMVAKTGTASGMCDASAIIATREFLVGAWSGRFDGAPTRGMSGMWGAGPLAKRALELALQGRAPTLPSPTASAAANGGERAAAAVRAQPTQLTAETDAWAGRARALGPRTAHTRR